MRARMDVANGPRLAVTHVYLTIDTEYSAGRYAKYGPSDREENFRKSIWGVTPEGAVGIGYQLDIFEQNGLKATFFVDPMPALVWGGDAISAIIRPILARGHDVQLHLHSEWLTFAVTQNLVGGRTGRNLKDFSVADQKILLDYAIGQLVAAGAARPIAFRAGNYGANDDTLVALASLGIAFDTSHSPGYAGSDCAISMDQSDLQPVERFGVIEVPIGAISSFGGRLRHAQITALSASEMIAAIGHARARGTDQFTLVSHSFELLSRDRSKINHILKRRFERFCHRLGKMDGVTTESYASRPPIVGLKSATSNILPHNPMRTAMRMAEQFIGNRLYGGA
jgi:hypothetical protein